MSAGGLGHSRVRSDELNLGLEVLDPILVSAPFHFSFVRLVDSSLQLFCVHDL